MVEMITVDYIKDFVIEKLEDKKALDISVIDLRGKSEIANYMIFANGRSNKNVMAIAEHLSLELKNILSIDVAIEGFRQSDWIVLDLGNIIVNIFHPEARLYYNIEEHWQKK